MKFYRINYLIFRPFTFVFLAIALRPSAMTSVISSCLDEILQMENFPVSPIFDSKPTTTIRRDDKSIGNDLCAFDELSHDRHRLGCCKPESIKILENVLLQGETFYHPDDSFLASNFLNESAKVLPVIRTSFQRKELTFRMLVTNKRTMVPCKKFFNGTLHVIDRATMHNMFHICEYFLSLL